MHEILLLIFSQSFPLHGLQCLIISVFLPIGPVLSGYPTPKNEIVGSPKAADI